MPIGPTVDGRSQNSDHQRDDHDNDGTKRCDSHWPVPVFGNFFRREALPNAIVQQVTFSAVMR